MNKIRKYSNKHVDVILVVPLGLENGIFPWGVHSLRDYIGNTCDSTNVQIWDFRNDQYIEELYNCYSNLLNNLFFLLKEEDMNTILGWTAINPHIFFGFVACNGKDFFEIAGISRWFCPSYSRDLHALQCKFEAHIADKIGAYTNKTKTNTIRIWGLSVYDRTLFNSLYIARLIKQYDPTASIVLGGDYFGFESAEKAIKCVPFVDGIVVGYGEEIMNNIVLAQQNGTPIRNLKMKGLLTRLSLEEAQSFKEVLIPPVYKDLSKDPPISYVQQQKPGEIRILSQRGCSWGKCTFCTQIDKEMFFPISFEHLRKELQEKINASNSDDNISSIKISFDSDENSIDMVIRLIKYLDSIEYCNVPFDIKLWFQVKSFRKELAEVLNTIDNEKIRIFFVLNFESLNVDTLRTMRKGHSPLQAIEAAKAIQDCGFNFQTNYFIHYPLETSSNMFREVEILKRATHLLMPPKGHIMLIPYYGNNRDAIFKNQEKYKVKIRRLGRDTWLNDVFGVDLPFSMWVHDYDQKLSSDLERLLIHTYHKKIKARDVVNRPRRLKTLKWGKEKTQLKGIDEFYSRYIKYHFVSRLLKLLFWGILHYLERSFVFLVVFGIIFALLFKFTFDFLVGIVIGSVIEYFYGFVFGKGRAFRKRTRMFNYLKKIMEADTAPKKNFFKRLMKRKIRKSYFYLEENYLKKEYNGPGIKEKWSKSLSDNEINVLRYLYWIRKRKHVMEKFKEEMSEVEIAKIIDRHIKMGSVVQFKHSILSVVNDPGYWK